MTLANCHPDFQQTIRDIAEFFNHTTDLVYSLWQEYSKQCSNGDQSPVIFEFKRWYAVRLAGLDPRVAMAAPKLLSACESAANWFGELSNDDGAQGLLDELREAIASAVPPAA